MRYSERPGEERAREERPLERAAVVAVIGGGASGTLASAYLLWEAAAARLPTRIVLIDRLGRHGLGQAYATEHPAHLLNSRAARMSALTDEPADFTRWVAAQGIQHDGFLPRSVYGQYLREVLASAERDAGPTGTVSRVTADVVAVTPAGPREPLRLRLAAGGSIQADAVVLASGNRPPAPPCAMPATPRYIADPWAPGALGLIADGGSVAVIGTGLTMIDVAITVTGAQAGTHVYAVSRHGLLPRPHVLMPGSAGVSPVHHLGTGPSVGLAALIRAVRAAAVDSPDGWEAAIDRMRPEIPLLWQGLSPHDRGLFLRHVARYWEVHRHRMPPATARRVARLRSTGRLSVLSGRVVSVDENRSGLRIGIEQPEGLVSISAGWLVNATGAAGDVTLRPDPLVRGLLSSGLAVPDPLRLGITADGDGAVLNRAGLASDRLFTLGPPLRGQLYETTAIPEIRDQAARLARRLVLGSSARVAAESVA